MLNDIALVILGALVGALVSHWLHKHPARLDKDRTLIIGLVDSLRELLSSIRSRVDQGNLFPNNLTPIRKLLHESETQAAYLNLPQKTKNLIADALEHLDSFTQGFVAVKDAIYPFYSNLKEPRGGGSATEVVATELVCMAESEIPSIPLKVNFPRDFSGHISQANLTPEQVRDLWSFGQRKAAIASFKASQSAAADALARLDTDLERLQKR